MSFPGARIVALSVIMAVLLVAVWAIYLFLDGRAPQSVTVTLSDFKGVELTYDATQRTSTSPLCGCLFPETVGDWRGISFAARHLTVERLAATDTAVFVTAAFPGPITLRGGLPLQARLWVLRLGRADRFEPKTVLDADVEQLKARTGTVSWAHVPMAQFLSFAYNGPLHVFLEGTTPLGAWIPSDNAHVRISDINGASTPVVVLQEHYKGTGRVPDFAGPSAADESAPAADFYADAVVLWSEGIWPYFSNSLGTLVSSSTSADDRLITAAVIYSPHATRVAFFPADIEGIERLNASTGEHHVLPIAGLDRGIVRVSISSASLSNDDAAAMLTDAVANTIRLPRETAFKGCQDEQRQRPCAQPFQTMAYRLPPIPPTAGLHVWGQMERLLVREAIGFVRGTSTRNIDGPVDLSLSEFEPVRIDDEVFTLPVRSHDGTRHTSFRVNRTVEIDADGIAITKRLHYFDSFVNFCISIGAVAAVGAIVWAAARYLHGRLVEARTVR